MKSVSDSDLIIVSVVDRGFQMRDLARIHRNKSMQYGIKSSVAYDSIIRMGLVYPMDLRTFAQQRISTPKTRIPPNPYSPKSIPFFLQCILCTPTYRRLNMLRFLDNYNVNPVI